MPGHARRRHAGLSGTCWRRRCTTARSTTPCRSSRTSVGSWESWAVTGWRGTIRRTPTSRGSAMHWPRATGPWRPAVAPVRWRPRTSAHAWPTTTRPRSPACWPRSPRCPRSSRTGPPGHRSPSVPSRTWPTPGVPSAFPRGSTVTSRPTRSARRSRSTSATRSARTCCWRCVVEASCSCPAPPARSRRSSRRPARTSTHRSRRWSRWSSSARDYWTRTLPAWPLVRALGEERPFGASAHLVDDPEEVPALLAG